MILDDKTSFAAAADRAMVDTVSSDELRLPTVNDVCLVRRSNDWTVSVTDELKLMTVDDNNVTLARADRALDEVVSSVVLMLSIRDTRWRDCLDSALFCSRVARVSADMKVRVEFSSVN